MSDDFLNPLHFKEIDQINEKELEEVFQVSNQEHYELCLRFKRCFGTEDGQFIIKHLREMTVENATWRPSLDYKQAIANGFAREGQNAMYRYMEDRIREADILAEQFKGDAKHD